MKAEDIRLTELLEGLKHFIVPIFQRDYSWGTMLGEDWKTKQETWLHRLGNITLTGYNPEYKDRPFATKKAIEGGFNDSPLRLNKFIREQEVWTTVEMEKRSHRMPFL